MSHRTPALSRLPVLVALTAATAAVAAPPKFAELGYPTRPLVQAGTGNLLPPLLLGPARTQWRATGDVTVVDRDGEKCLRFGPKSSGRQAAIHVQPTSPPRGLTSYLLRLEAMVSRDTGGEGPAGLTGWLAATSAGVSAGELKVLELRRGDRWLPLEFRLFTRPRPDTLGLNLGFDGDAGWALIRRCELVEEPVKAADGRVILETRTAAWMEAPHEPQPPAPAEPVLWAPADPDHLFPSSHPGAADLRRSLQFSGAPGEMCVAAVALHTPRALPGLRLQFSRLTGSAGDLGALPTWKWVIYQPRRTDFYGRGRGFRYVPDFFLSRPEGVDCPAGETTVLWLNLRLPQLPGPGRLYRGQVQAVAAGLKLSLPVQVRIYPFVLAEGAPRTRHLCADTWRWSKMTDEQVVSEIGDMRDHGFESCDLPVEGKIVFENRRATHFAPDAGTARGIRLALQAHMKGPFTFWFGWMDTPLARALELPHDALRGKADTWPEAFTAAAVETLRLARAEFARAGIADPLFTAVDEPGYWKPGSPERLAWDVKVAHAADWPVYCTSSYRTADPLGQGIDNHCYAGLTLTADPRQAAAIAQETRAAGQKLWYYCTGAYSGQIGNMLPNRYLAGFMFVRLGADGSASWTFQRPKGNAFDDFGQDEAGRPTSGQPCIVYPDPEHPGLNLDTPAWEGLRQAWYDDRYVETLRQATARARARREAAAATTAEQGLREQLARLPWNGDPLLDPALTNPRLNKVRADLAEMIVSLTPSGHRNTAPLTPGSTESWAKQATGVASWLTVRR